MVVIVILVVAAATTTNQHCWVVGEILHRIGMVQFVYKALDDIARERKTMVCLEADCVSRKIPKGSIHYNLRRILGYGNPYKHCRRARPQDRNISCRLDRGETGTCNPMKPPATQQSSRGGEDGDNNSNSNNRCGFYSVDTAPEMDSATCYRLTMKSTSTVAESKKVSPSRIYRKGG